MRPSTLVKQVGGTYASELGIDLAEAKPGELHKWFLAAILFGARISGKVAANTYREFVRAAILSPAQVLDAGWDKLVEILDRGGYARYDFKTATKLLDVNRTLLRQYRGDLNALHASAADSFDLERRLKGLGKGMGDITVNIFLRELRGIWPKADPLPSPRAMRAAQALGFVPAGLQEPASILRALRAAWRTDRRAPQDFTQFEAALVRYESTLRKKGRGSMPDVKSRGLPQAR